MAKNADLSQHEGNLIKKDKKSNTRSQMAYILAAEQCLSFQNSRWFKSKLSLDTAFRVNCHQSQISIGITDSYVDHFLNDNLTAAKLSNINGSSYIA